MQKLLPVPHAVGLYESRVLNQYLNNILNGDGRQFLKLSVQNIEECIASRDAMFRLQRDES